MLALNALNRSLPLPLPRLLLLSVRHRHVRRLHGRQLRGRAVGQGGLRAGHPAGVVGLHQQQHQVLLQELWPHRLQKEEEEEEEALTQREGL